MSEPIPQRPPRPHRGFALLPTLMVSIGLLVLIAVGSVEALQWITGRAIIQEFAVRLIDRTLAIHEQALQRDLRAAVDDGAFIANAIKTGEVDMFDSELEHFAAGALGAAPQISSVLVGSPQGKVLRALRGRRQNSHDVSYIETAGDPELTAIAADIAGHGNAYWGPPVYSAARNATYLNYRVPLRVRNTYLGFVVVTVSTEALSSLAAELSDPPQTLSFMLYGPDAVLAHPLLMQGSAGRSEDQPLPDLGSLGDPILEDLPGLAPLTASGIEPPPGAEAREAHIGSGRYAVFTRPVANFADLPITVGIYSLYSTIDEPLRLFYSRSLLALAMLVLALAAAAFLARIIARPIRRAATGAAAISDLDFDKVAPLPPSYLRETNDLAASFNAMLEGLKAFGLYVPRGLVSRLLKEGRVGAGTEQRTLAIMFTDIVGFTPICENLTAAEVADFINSHLTLLGASIEAEGGTIDKYIGDAVMAFWGAPGKVDNPAAAACRAALAIRAAIAADNTQRLAAGLRPVALRIGIHLGDVIVGDIGAPERINYTVVGDAVNTAQRLENLGKSLAPEAAVVVLISGDVARALPAGFSLADHGRHQVKGKHQTLHVFELQGLA